ncbi:MAG: efflux RND transporter periplasmic adaptor subunit [Planctomycetota bacterium]
MTRGTVIRLVGTVVIIGLVGTALGAVRLFSSPSTTDAVASDTAAPMDVETMTIEWTDSFERSRIYVGRIEAHQQVELAFELGGRIAAINGDDGDTVNAGDIIAVLDTLRLEAQREQFVAAMNEAQANADLAESTLQRIRDVSKRGAANPQEIDDAMKASDAASARLNRARADLNAIDVEIGKSTIVAPFDAVIARRDADLGDVVPSGAAVVTLLERQRPEARIGLAGGAAREVLIGDEVDVAVQGRIVRGTIKSLLPTRERGMRTVEARIVLDTQLNGIRVGDIAELSLRRVTEERGFWVPTSALSQSVRGLWAMYVVTPGDSASSIGTIERREVELLHTESERLFVRGPIDEGDLIVAAGRHRLVPGLTVRISERSGD